jgi:antibiotic biosynthesis monooxygenase (ABM) superfamily enzyme
VVGDASAVGVTLLVTQVTLPVTAGIFPVQILVVLVVTPALGGADLTPWALQGCCCCCCC